MITGASRGIGRATALSYARAGASGIAVAARSSEALEELENAISKLPRGDRPAPKVLKINCDVTNDESIEDAERVVRSTFGRLDILINNAGTSEPMLPILDSDPDTWWNTWVVNMRGPYLMTRTFLPLLLESEDGHKIIINMSSVGAVWMSTNLSSYQVRSPGRMPENKADLVCFFPPDDEAGTSPIRRTLGA